MSPSERSSVPKGLSRALEFVELSTWYGYEEDEKNEKMLVGVTSANSPRAPYSIFSTQHSYVINCGVLCRVIT